MDFSEECRKGPALFYLLLVQDEEHGGDSNAE